MKKDTASFKDEAFKIHGDMYDYTKSTYTNATTKLIITCTLHGDFLQIPRKHLSGQGCPDCGGRKAYTPNEIKDICTSVHCGFYDYTETLFSGVNSRISIKCPIHGVYETNTQSHMNGAKCRKCSFKTTSMVRQNNNSIKIITKMKEMYDNEFIISENEYNGRNEKMAIICIKHSYEFQQTPSNFLAGKRGCEFCNSENTSSRKMQECKIALNNIGVNYILEKRFSDCKNIRPLPFDIFIEDLNICIEVDGEQHFSSNKWGGELGLVERQKNDSIKTKYCNDNGIKLIRIRFDENPIDILKQNGL